MVRSRDAEVLALRGQRVTRSESRPAGRAGVATARRACLVHVLAGHAPIRPGYVAWLTDLGVCTLGAGAHGHLVVTGAPQARKARLELDDPWASTDHAHLRASFGGFLLEDAGSKNGIRVGGVRARRHRLCDGDRIEIGRTHLLYREQDVDLAVGVEPGIAPATRLGAMATLAGRWAAELATLAQLARTELSVLLLGETGAGKEVLAHAIHEASQRRGPLVPINCGALPVALAEGLLFGHRRGAYSGAVSDSAGFLRSAAGGTVFLDEIGDLPLALQPVLLRVLQDRAVVALGDTRADVIDIRFVAATNRDLDRLVADDQFRGDLLARLANHRVALPAVRARPEDLGLLIGAILRDAGAREAALSPEACRALLGHAWPGNVRELSATLRRALVLAGGGPIDRAHLPAALDASERADEQDGSSAFVGPPEGLDVEDRRRYDQLVAQLVEHRGNVSAVARSVGKDRRQIHRWLRKFGLRPERFGA